MEADYPMVGFSFSVSIDGGTNKLDNAFQEVSGIQAEFETEEVKEGGENRFSHRVPGRARYNNLVLKRGLMQKASNVSKWVRTTMNDGLNTTIKPKTILVSMLNPQGNPVMTWTFANAYPVKWELSNLNAQENSLAIETLEFAYNSFTRTQ